MNTTPRRLLALASVTLTGVVLSACATSGTLDPAEPDSETIVIGSQDYYSNEIVAEIYAQALEAAGYSVQRDFRIGQREVYVQDIEDGAVDLFPEYSGPLLQYWVADTPARFSDDVYAALVEAAPDGVRILDQATATDQDTYVVTKAFAETWGVESIADLADVGVPMTLGGNSEGEDRPNGPKGLEAAYGVEVTFTPIEDGGGPLTVRALKDGQVELAIMYTANPAIADPDIFELEDPEGLFLASHVVPVASDKLDAEAVRIINQISAALTPEGLIELNARSIDEQAPASTIAAAWLAEHDLG
jgi:osmoprotectant transport system substrate-binding protein